MPVDAGILRFVLVEGLKLLLDLWRRPAAAMGAVLDRGSALFALIAALAASWLLRTTAAPGLGFFLPVVALALAYVPGVLLLGALFGRLGSLGTVFQRDYSPLLTCTAMAWTAAAIPLAVAAYLVPAEALPWLAAPAALCFAIWMFFAVRTLFGVEAEPPRASWGCRGFRWWRRRFCGGRIRLPAGLAGVAVLSVLRLVLSGRRTRQPGRGTAQPARASAAIWRRRPSIPTMARRSTSLGLIYQQRRQYTEAIRRFQNAVAIDPEATDAHFQLGRIAREQGRLEDALAEFQTVLRQDEKHNLSEIRRDLGGAYLAAGRLADARRELGTIRTAAPTIRKASATSARRSKRWATPPPRARCISGPWKPPAPPPATAAASPPHGAGWRRSRPASWRGERAGFAKLAGMELHLPPESEAKLNALAQRTRRGTDELLQEAVDHLVTYSEWFERKVKASAAAADLGETVPDEEVRAWIERRERG